MNAADGIKACCTICKESVLRGGKSTNRSTRVSLDIGTDNGLMHAFLYCNYKVSVKSSISGTLLTCIYTRLISLFT